MGGKIIVKCHARQVQDRRQGSSPCLYCYTQYNCHGRGSRRSSGAEKGAGVSPSCTWLRIAWSLASGYDGESNSWEQRGASLRVTTRLTRMRPVEGSELEGLIGPNIGRDAYWVQVNTSRKVACTADRRLQVRSQGGKSCATDTRHGGFDIRTRGL